MQQNLIKKERINTHQNIILSAVFAYNDLIAPIMRTSRVQNGESIKMEIYCVSMCNDLRRMRSCVSKMKFVYRNRSDVMCNLTTVGTERSERYASNQRRKH